MIAKLMNGSLKPIEHGMATLGLAGQPISFRRRHTLDLVWSVWSGIAASWRLTRGWPLGPHVSLVAFTASHLDHSGQ